jgi:hypothetical protein
VAAIEVVSAEPVETSFWICSVASTIDGIARSAAHRVQRFDQRHARGKHGGQGARPARDDGLVDQVAEDRHLEQQPVHEHLHLLGSLPALKEEVPAAEDEAKDGPPPGHEELGHGQITNSVGAGRSAPKDLNTSSKAGITKIMITVTTTKATTTTAMGYIRADLILA